MKVFHLVYRNLPTLSSDPDIDIHSGLSPAEMDLDTIVTSCD